MSDNNPTSHVRTAAVSVGIAVNITATIRSSLTMQHIQSADFFAQQAAKIERESQTTGVRFGDAANNIAAPQHQAYVIGSIFAAVAFLEAAVNDLLAQTADPMYAGGDFKGTWVEHVTPEVRTRLGDAWRGTGPFAWTRKALVREAGVLVKFDTVLDLAEQSFSAQEMGGGTPYDHVGRVIEFRNYLMHNIPSTTTHTGDADVFSDDKETAKLSKKLEARKVAPNTLGGATPSSFPARYLSAGCAGWAVRSAAQFALAFYAKIGITSPFNNQLQKYAR